jgi:hypothetical protein
VPITWGVNEIARFATVAVIAMSALYFGLTTLLPKQRVLNLEPPAGVEFMPHADGVLTRVDESRLVLRTRAGDRTFTIERADRDRFDIAHLRSHAADRLPVRLSYERRDGTPAARWAVDAPSQPAR